MIENIRDSNTNNNVHIWVNPPSTSLPITRSPVRFAVGTPTGLSTNSWRVWADGEDTYITCRDNFRQFKVSLHASGIWRVGFTQEFADARPDIVPANQDRVWKKRTPIIDANNPFAVGFQILVPQPSLYIHPKNRKRWPESIVFLEPPMDSEKMTVIAVTVVLGHQSLSFPAESTGAVFGMFPIGTDRTVQLVVTHEKAENTLNNFKNAFRQGVKQLDEQNILPKKGIVCLHGERGKDIPWVTFIPFQAYNYEKN